ncbi:MAG: molecular chaperone TorD family protein [Desulfovibrionaceae bacterium]|nr:molecular chaperone TorD family protein [Desulfovibrionaceae bacterium]
MPPRPTPPALAPEAAASSPAPDLARGVTPDTAPELMAEILRDLFAARDSGGLARALERLAACGAEDGGAGGSRPDGEAPRRAPLFPEAEYAFNRLFVGPDHVPAPPYASVYLDADPLLMGRATASMRELFRSLGLAVREEDNLPEDHLACELEAWLVLRSLAGTKDATLRQNVEEALVWLVDGHMRLWIPQFLSRARAEAVPEALSGALNRLEAWLERAGSELNRA